MLYHSVTRRILTILPGAVLALCMNYPALAAILPQPPQINAKAYVLMDYNSGRILNAQEANTRIEPASLTKMMTMYVVDQEIKQGRLKLTDIVTVSEKAWREEGTRMFLEANSKVSVNDLIHGVIVHSGNDACVALAEHIAGSTEAFTDLMNQYAMQLKLANTHFMNVTGLSDPEHYSTAEDLANLSRALIRDFPESYALYSEKWFTHNGIKQPNRNRLLWRSELVDGIKTGNTNAAGFCLSASAKKADFRLISVVMGAKSDAARTEETQKLISYGFRFYESHKLLAKEQNVKNVRVWLGKAKMVTVGPKDDVFLTLPQGERERLEATLTLNRGLKAPLKAGDVVGLVNVQLDGQT
ncbi:MAG: D-alanyl-D-alanine carboxypeptidase family protein, partial [Pseudomonadota bacterium]